MALLSDGDSATRGGMEKLEDALDVFGALLGLRGINASGYLNMDTTSIKQARTDIQFCRDNRTTVTVGSATALDMAHRLVELMRMLGTVYRFLRRTGKSTASLDLNHGPTAIDHTYMDTLYSDLSDVIAELGYRAPDIARPGTSMRDDSRISGDID